MLLVSQDFLASQFVIKKELPSIMQAAADEGLKVIWIPLSAGLYERHGLDRIQAAHDPRQPLDTLSEAQQRVVLTSIARKIFELFPLSS